MSLEQRTQKWLSSFHWSHQEIDKEKYSSLRSGRTLSVLSGKGGVGKTSISLKLASELAGQNLKILVIDLDYNLANCLIKLGLPIRNDFWDLLNSKKSFDDCLNRLGNLHILSGCSGSLDLFENEDDVERIIIDIIHCHKDEYDFVIIDSPAGLSKKVLTINSYTDDRLVVLTPDKSSLTDAYSSIKVLYTKYGVHTNHILVNKVHSVDQYKKCVKTLSETIETFLGCRSIFLGGIKWENIAGNEFDKFLFEDKKSSLHRTMGKVVNYFTDKLSSETTHGISPQ
jgi:flagellar biosynthesis protein FlhG